MNETRRVAQSESPFHDHRDLALEDAALDHLAFAARVVDLENERDTYRLMVQEAIHLLHHRTRERDRLRRRLRALVEQLDALAPPRRAA